LFSTFARWEVLHSIQDYIRKNQPYLGSGDTQENEEEDTHFVTDKADPSPGPEEIYLARESEAVRRQLLRFCENDRERMILERRWLAEGEVPLWQIGEIFGVSFERVRQIESRLFRRIRQGLTLKS
jgi:RNA polymerase sigma factor (sigma-70 family)